MTSRIAAYQVLMHVSHKHVHPDEMLRTILKRFGNLSSSDRALATELVYGVLRWQGRLDWHIAQLSKISIKKIDPLVQLILRLGLYQLFFLDRVPAYAAVDETVKIAKSTQPKHVISFVNAILRKAGDPHISWNLPDPSTDPVEYLAVKTSHPPWVIEKLLKSDSFEEVESLCNANNEIAPLSLRVDVRDVNGKERIIKWLQGRGYNPESCSYSPCGIVVKGLRMDVTDLEIYKEGLVQVQDEASQLVSYFVDPQENERVLDLCCGKGTKSTHLAQLMGNKGFILAVDSSSWKLEALKERAERMNITIIETLCKDIRLVEPSEVGLFDKVVLDAPCTGWGTIRRNPDIKWKTHPRDPWRMSKLQEELLNRAALFVRPGGTLTYITCSIFEDENEMIARRFEAKWQWQPVMKESVMFNKIRRISKNQSPYLRTAPHLHNMDGFFVASWRKA